MRLVSPARVPEAAFAYFSYSHPGFVRSQSEDEERSVADAIVPAGWELSSLSMGMPKYPDCGGRQTNVGEAYVMANCHC
jgi:hypothetical protein